MVDYQSEYTVAIGKFMLGSLSPKRTALFSNKGRRRFSGSMAISFLLQGGGRGYYFTLIE